MQIYVGHSCISNTHTWEAEAGVYCGKFKASLCFTAGLGQLMRSCLNKVKQTKRKIYSKK